MSSLQLDEEHSHPLSYANRSVRLFEQNGQLLRGVDSQYAKPARHLWDSGVLPSLIEQGLFVETRLLSDSSADYPVVFQHERMSPITYPVEWPPEALRAAGLAVLDMQNFLVKHGYVAGDVSPWNILFDGMQPTFVDLGSLLWDASQGAKQFLSEFNRYYIWPLQLAKKNLWNYAVALLGDYNNGVRYGDALLLLGARELSHSGTLLESIKTHARATAKKVLPESIKKKLKSSNTSSSSPAKTNVRALGAEIDRLRRALLDIKLPEGEIWTSYYEDFPQHGQTFSETADWNPKQLAVSQIFEQIAPSSLFDICSNRGWYSLLAETMGIRVIAADIVWNVMDQLYLRSKEGNHRIYPVVMDFCNPTPARGIAYRWFQSAVDRFQSEMVICLAAIHNLVFGAQLSFDQIVAGLESFTSRWLLLEFVPKEDDTAGKFWRADSHDWYVESNLIKALERRFEIRKIIASYPEPRKLILCELRKAPTR